MCGIFGIISKHSYELKQALQRLELLEYRGYDSVGISTLDKNKLNVYKSVGYIKTLYDKISSKKSKNIICHTRWATHGNICEKNTHPHHIGKVCIVHNGIIDNYKDLIKSLNLKDKLISDCDSEIIAQTIDRQFFINGVSMSSFIDAISLLEGSYAILAQIQDCEKCIYGAKNKSPLYVGKMEDGYVFSSDLIAFQGLIKEYYELNDGECFIANGQKITFFNMYNIQIEKESIEFKDFDYSCSKGEFGSFLEKEINDIPQALCNTLFHYKNSTHKIPELKDYKQIHIIACGTAYHSACIGKYIIENLLKIPCSCHIASEFLFQEILTDKNSLFIFISQSGETYDTLQALLKVKDLGYKTLGITNTAHSQLSKICNYCLPIYAGKEVSVASTKVYNCTILAIYFLCKKKDIDIDAKLLTDLIKSNKEDALATDMCKASTVIFIGKCEDYVSAMEGVLKYRELTYRNAISYPCGELKHGTLSIIDKNTLSIAILTQEKYANSIFTALNEIKTRNGKTALITTLDVPKDTADYIIKLERKKNMPINLYSIIPFQKLAYKSCNILNLNPDRPRNLAKSVTVQ